MRKIDNMMVLVLGLMTMQYGSVRAEEESLRTEPVRSLMVELPAQDHNAIKTSWPGIGCWFWTEEEFKPDGYKRFIDLHHKHSAFRLLTTSIRHPVEVTDPAVHDQIKKAAAYARDRDMGIVMDLDVRLARKAFMNRFPEELQEIVRLREVALKEMGEVSLVVDPVALGDHYTYRTRGYESVSSRVVRVYAYVTDPQGIDPIAVEDITSRCRIVRADRRGVEVAISCGAPDKGRSACVLAAFTLFTPDLFAPHLTEFERGILKQYADVPLAGACKDEWGFPGRFDPRTDDLFYSRFMAEAYARRRPGRDLVRDLLLMFRKEKGRERQRTTAINHYMEMCWQRNVEIEDAFYRSTKEVFGKAAMVGTHPTWIANPSSVGEVFKNGLDWWNCRRDLAQTDEATPFCVDTALAKKWHSPLWYNMTYASSIKPYEKFLWEAARAGGRMNFHPFFPIPDWWQSPSPLSTSLLSGNLLAADCRVRLLNYISTKPLDCPIAVVFGHPSALNWAGPGLADAGLAIANELWSQGFLTDLIPSSEIALGNLGIAEDGRLRYGPQHYTAAVLYHPQFERPAVAELFKKVAASGKTALFRVGDWTVDFEGSVFDAGALPSQMKLVDPGAAIRETIAFVKAAGIAAQTGQTRLLDGTVIVASGEKDVMGDPIQKTILVNGHEISLDAVGVAGIRLDKTGKLEALAAGGLKFIRGGGLAVELAERVDLAIWQDNRGQKHGVLQNWSGPVPAALSAITGDWVRLSAPTPYQDTKELNPEDLN